MLRRLGFVVLASMSCIGAARAVVYTLGSDGACNYTTIADALAAAEMNPGADTINIASNFDNALQTITFSTAQQLELAGGFADCSKTASDGSHAVIDGNLRITADTGGVVQLTNLTIQHGDVTHDPASGGKGGGIYFKGNGTLELDRCTVTLNSANFGGGIYAEGTGVDTKLVIGTDVAILGNTARNNGGGVVDDGATLTMTAPDSYIANNHALGDPSNGLYGGFGGGLLVLADAHKSRAFLGSSGFGSVGTIYVNDALYGGGIAVLAPNETAELNVFSTDPARPMRIKGNAADQNGGGLFVGSSSGNLPTASTKVWYATFEDNIATLGAAVYLSQFQGPFFFNDPAQRPAGSIDCPVGKPCGGVIGNLAQNFQSQLSGPVVQTDPGVTARFNRMEVRNNTGLYVFYASLNSNVGLALHHVAITDNTTDLALISTIADQGPDGYVDIEDSTIAGNAIGNNKVLRVSNTGGMDKVYRSIIWQPGSASLEASGLPVDLLDNIDSDGTTSVVIEDPRFVDPANGNYALRAASPAIDFAASVANDGQDLYSNPRDVDLPIAENFHGTRDVGAIERQTLQPIVLNADFDADLRFWSAAAFDVTTRDTTRNASGAAGSGSAHVSQTGTTTGSEVKGLVQCMHLPGPGVYTLNGFGRGTGTMVIAGDIAELFWEFRKSGGEACTNGAPDATGTKVLTSGSNFSRPATPAFIDVSRQDWTRTSSIAVTLVAVENGPSGPPTNAWFDGITLDVDTIFADAFESPSASP